MKLSVPILFWVLCHINLTLAESVQTTVGYLPISDHLILGLANTQFKDVTEPAAINPIRFSDWPSITEALRAGSLDGAFLLAPLAFKAKAVGAPISIVLLGHRNGSALIVHKNSTIKKVAHLANKRVATPSRFSTHNMLLSLYLESDTKKLSDKVLRIEMAPPEMPAALARGDIDAYIVAEPFGAWGELRGFARVLSLSNSIWEDHPDCVLVLRNKFIETNPKAVENFIFSLVKSGEYAEHNRQKTASEVSSFLGHKSATLEYALKMPSTKRVTFSKLIPQVEELQRMADYMSQEMGLFKETPIVSQMLQTKFAELAYKRLESQ